jgi:hypothetical protein
MKTPADKAIAFTFGSYPMDNPSHRWSAVVSFPPGSTAQTVLPITIVDGNGESVKSGVFEFAGQKLTVSDGKAQLTYGDFIKGKHSVPLWLHRKGMDSVIGGLTFA